MDIFITIAKYLRLWPHCWRTAGIQLLAEEASRSIAAGCEAELLAFEAALKTLGQMEERAGVAIVDLAAGPEVVPSILRARMEAVLTRASGPAVTREQPHGNS